tara:strand:+ start:261 stop:725 length:465 start_codon:yes stop_codon:yes gene_type:complete
MFGFSKSEKVTDAISAALHSQLYAAMNENEALTNERLLSLFTNGYIISFVYSIYGLHGLKANAMFNKNLNKILNGILPDRLEEVFMRQNEMRKMTESMDTPSAEMLLGNQNPKYFTESQLLARKEAGLYMRSNDVEDARAWYSYLTGKGEYSTL